MIDADDFRFLNVRQAPRTIFARLEEFRQFEHGWNFGEGEPFDERVLETAGALSSRAAEMGFVNQETFPGMSGEVLVCLYPGEQEEIEITVGKDGAVELFVEVNGDCLEDQRDLTMEDAVAWLRKLRQRTGALSGSSTLNTTTASKRTDSTGRPFLLPAATAGSPSLRRTAPSGSAEPYAVT